MKANLKKIIFISLAIISIILIFRFIELETYINIQTLKENRLYLLMIVKDYYLLSALIYIFSYILIAVLALPITVPLTLIGGFLFDVIPAVIYTNIGATIGGTLSFLIVRYLLGTNVQKTYSNRLSRFNKNVEKYGISYLLTARFIAIIPFFLVNILSALTKIPLKSFIWTTSIGIIPGSFVYAYAGKNIINIDSTKDIFSTKTIIAFGLLILFGIFSIMLKKLDCLKLLRKTKLQKR